MTTPAELQKARIKQRFLNVKADYNRNGDTISVHKNGRVFVFSLNNCTIQQLEDLLSEWGETHEL